MLVKVAEHVSQPIRKDLLKCIVALTGHLRLQRQLLFFQVFCDKLVNKLFANQWSKNNKYLVACRDTGRNITQRLNELRLTWSWNLPDV